MISTFPPGAIGQCHMQRLAPRPFELLDELAAIEAEILDEVAALRTLLAGA